MIFISEIELINKLDRLEERIEILERRINKESKLHSDAIEKLQQTLVEHEEYMASKLRVLDYHTLLR